MERMEKKKSGKIIKYFRTNVTKTKKKKRASEIIQNMKKKNPKKPVPQITQK